MYESVPMNKTELEIRTWFSPGSAKDFDDMYYCRVLGAANNIRMIGGMYADLAATAAERKLDTNALLERVSSLNHYFVQKRGRSSYAIIAAIHIMTGQLWSLQDNSLGEVCLALNSAYEAYITRSNAWNQTIRENLWNVIDRMERVLLFDYSSTVNAVMEVAQGKGKQLEVFVPESRILDGGHAYVRNAVQMKHKVHYFPDAALAQFVEKIDAAFIGAETFFPNGSVANTVGSDVIAILCQYYRRPLYVPTQLIKVDPRGFAGLEKQSLIEDTSPYFGLQLEQFLRNETDMSLSGLVTVPSHLITAFITEEGVIPPSAMYQISKAYIDRMENTYESPELSK